jgi:hypothetical protein
MNVYIAPRRSGKTTKLLKIAAERGGIIVTHSMDSVKRLQHRAREMGLTIKKPVTIYQVRVGDALSGIGDTELYLDDADMIIQNYLQVRIHTLTMSGEGQEITERKTVEPPPHKPTRKRTVKIK